jgi:hypothetical protein
MACTVTFGLDSSTTVILQVSRRWKEQTTRAPRICCCLLGVIVEVTETVALQLCVRQCTLGASYPQHLPSYYAAYRHGSWGELILPEVLEGPVGPRRSHCCQPPRRMVPSGTRGGAECDCVGVVKVLVAGSADEGGGSCEQAWPM